ncbi:hypothetical protein FE697_010550 [Mumia zhuanghuii]|uniref:Uncharacterized protein n=2 Tax=Mumia TaxID=1546255 RepID=A0ABW1QGN3_9ACTN|nr:MULTISPECIES: hypothetical protein [Mumia]KAA1422623.1 hypothetical protein FE697_010550 [Mumia zhuanghuii]
MTSHRTVLAQAVLVGTLCGVGARVLMRMITDLSRNLPEFTWGGTLALVIIFVIAAVAAAGAALARGPVLVRAVLGFLPAALIAFVAVMNTVPQVEDVLAVPSSDHVRLTAMAVGIVVLALATAAVPWTLGLRARRTAVVGVAATLHQ